MKQNITIDYITLYFCIYIKKLHKTYFSFAFTLNEKFSSI